MRVKNFHNGFVVLPHYNALSFYCAIATEDEETQSTKSNHNKLCSIYKNCIFCNYALNLKIVFGLDITPIIALLDDWQYLVKQSMILKECEIQGASVEKLRNLSWDLHWEEKYTGSVTGFRLLGSVVYDLVKVVRLSLRFCSHFAEAGFMLHSVAGKVRLRENTTNLIHISDIRESVLSTFVYFVVEAR